MSFGLRVRNFAIVVLLLTATGGAWAQTSKPISVVQKFQDRLLTVMQESKTLDVRARYNQLLPAVEEAFSVQIMVASTIGNHWKSASSEAKMRLVTAFLRKNVSTVATLFSDYSGQKFEILGEKPAPQNTRLVMTRIVDDEGEVATLDYRLYRIDGRWRIIDVIVDHGISEMMTRRSEFSDVLNKKGVDGLTALLNEKANELLAQ